jgi:hypothetical protein
MFRTYKRIRSLSLCSNDRQGAGISSASLERTGSGAQRFAHAPRHVDTSGCRKIILCPVHWPENGTCVRSPTVGISDMYTASANLALVYDFCHMTPQCLLFWKGVSREILNLHPFLAQFREQPYGDSPSRITTRIEIRAKRKTCMRRCAC